MIPLASPPQWGAPFFAFLAKGYHERLRDGFARNGQRLRRHIAAHPFDRFRAGSCKERKDGGALRRNGARSRSLKAGLPSDFEHPV